MPGLVILTKEQIKQREPNVSDEAIAALFAPTVGIICPWEYAIALTETAMSNGVTLSLNSRVTGVERNHEGYRITTVRGTIDARYVLNAAGLNSDEVHNMVAAPAFEIIPDRGVYYLLDKTENGLINHVIFHCPLKEGKGTLVAPTIHGNVIVGPNNEKPTGKDDVSVTRQGLETVADRAKKSVPGVNLKESIRNFAGVRAASDKDDFIIAQADGAYGFIDIAGIKSPGLTSAPAIAKMAAGLLEEAGLELCLKPDFKAERSRKRFKTLPIEEKNAIIKNSPAYGHVVCRCETVTEGEILTAIGSAIPPVSVEGVKRRCNAGMGRCQGGFCGPRVVEILSRELGISPLDVLLDKEGSFVFTGKGEADV